MFVLKLRRDASFFLPAILCIIGVSAYGASPAPVVVESRSTMLSDRFDQDSRSVQLPVEFPRDEPQETQTVEIVSDSSGEPPMDLPYKMQILQQEVMMLRGLVEQLSYEIQRSKKVQEDRYLELDRRLQSQTLVTKSAKDPLLVAEPGGQASVNDAVDDKALRTEKDYYDDGLKAIRSRRYEPAIEALRIVIDQFPTGIYAANAYYWIGEVHAAKPEPDYEAARQALVQVIKGYPESNKVPDAAFKLGKVYHLMGNCQRALSYLTEVKTEFASKSAGKLAEKYLQEQVDC
jgi:tol-pal system protein YbgF